MHRTGKLASSDGCILCCILLCTRGSIQWRRQGGGGGGGGAFSRPSIHLHTSFSLLFHLDLCAFTAIRWAGGAAVCCALEILPGHLRMRRHFRVVAFIPEPPHLIFWIRPRHCKYINTTASFSSYNAAVSVACNPKLSVFASLILLSLQRGLIAESLGIISGPIGCSGQFFIPYLCASNNFKRNFILIII